MNDPFPKFVPLPGKHLFIVAVLPGRLVGCAVGVAVTTRPAAGTPVVKAMAVPGNAMTWAVAALVGVAVLVTTMLDKEPPD